MHQGVVGIVLRLVKFYSFNRDMHASAKNDETRWMMANILISQARSASVVHAEAGHIAKLRRKEETHEQ